ncbi:hypothetical protein F3Y22_tig00110890pilonHSYRG01503 [Hibiscus syriacus]|uniref:Uncharacterized protein n=1 Tax=Hibiscus syriacus TaxID=106335 RepID=A0A6A2ZKK8_HIBSY|nr:hypothetical protein F3Y22_tig00110890pilonHSYRG01503 [Hibiscus syriacus]
MSSVSPAMLTILAALLHLTLYSICVTAATSYLDLQLLNVNQTLMGTKMFKFKPLETSEFHHLSNVSEIDDHRGEWELKLVHRDKLSSGVNSTFHHDRGRRFHARIKKDVKRVASLLLRLPGGRTHEGEAAYEVVILFGSSVSLVTNVIDNPTRFSTRLIPLLLPASLVATPFVTGFKIWVAMRVGPAAVSPPFELPATAAIASATAAIELTFSRLSSSSFVLTWMDMNSVSKYLKWCLCQGLSKTISELKSSRYIAHP